MLNLVKSNKSSGSEVLKGEICSIAEVLKSSSGDMFIWKITCKELINHIFKHNEILYVPTFLGQR